MPNDEAELLDLIADVNALGEGVLWVIDLNSDGGALLITLLLDHGQELIYVPGRTVHHASGSYRGDGKTDAKDAFVIADQARMRRDLHPIASFDEIAADLRILTARRTDLAADRTRAINRMRDQMLGYFPALERAFDYSKSKAALVLLSGYQTPGALCRLGRTRLETWLRARKVRSAVKAAETAIEAAQAQRTTVRGEKTAAAVVAKLAKEVIALDTEIAETDAAIEGRFRQHEHAAVITSLPDIGTLLGGGVHRRQWRRHDRVRQRQSSGRRIRTGSGTPGLGAYQRKPAPSTPLQSPSDAGVLHVRSVQHQLVLGFEGLLRAQEG